MSSQEPELPGDSGGERWARVIFWALLLYSLGLIILVIEDAMSHSFI